MISKIFLSRLNTQQSPNIPRVGRMCCPPSRNGNMPAVQVRPRCTRGEMILMRLGLITNSNIGQTRDVGNYVANPWGFFDMHGNVWEWTADWYGAYPAGNPLIDPTGEASGSELVSRGGSWYNVGTGVRSAKRFGRTPSHRFHSFGFRLALRQISLPPTDLNSTAPLVISENQPIGTIVGEFNATDPAGNATLTYHLVSGSGDGSNSLFTLETNGTLKTASLLDYESGANLSIRIQVKDEHNATSEGNFTVTLTDANDWVNGTVTLSGTAQVGQTLTASNNLTDQDGMGTITYLWQRDGKPSHGGYVKDGENGVDGLNSANRMTISPDGKHIYITAINDRAITWHERNATTGAVTFLGYVKDGENGVDGLRGARDVAISPDGNNVYAVAAADDGISWYDRNSTSGALTFRSFLKDNQNGMDGLNGAQALVISPDGKNIYIAGREEDAVTWVDRNTTTGEITFNGFLKNGTNGVSGLNFPVSIDISLDGKHIYLVGRDDNAVSWFDRNTTNGDLSFSGYVQNGSNGINNLLSPENLLLTSSGDFLYVSSPEANATLWFSRDSSTGNLTYISSITDGINGVSGIKGAYYLSLSPNEENLYVSAKTDYSIAWFDRNTTSGSLNYGGKLAYDTADYIPTKDPTGAQVSADGKYFYQLGGSSDDIAWLTRNPTSGALLYQKSGPSYTITNDDINKRISVVAKFTDGGGNLVLKSSSDTQLVQASPNSPPTVLNVAVPLTIFENQPIGTIVGDFNATDPDANATLTYSLVSGVGDTENYLFTLDHNGTLRTKTIFDFETITPTFSIRVQVKDEHEAIAQGYFSVTLQDWFDHGWDKVIAPDKSANDQFGLTVFQSGNNLVVGAKNSNPEDKADAGSAYIYHVDSNASTTLITKVTAPDKAANDQFATSVLMLK